MICALSPGTSFQRISGLLTFNKIKTWNNHHKLKLSSSSLSSSSLLLPVPTPNLLTSVPDEILTCIFEQLDSLSSVYQFALTCQKMYMVASTPRSLACWLMAQKGSRFAIYYAILSFPQLCDDHFIRMLINQGAMLSRHLVQQLVLLYGKSSSSTGNKLLFTQCLEQLPFSGYASLIHHGFQLYGNIMVTTDQSDYYQLMTSSDQNRMQAWEESIRDHCFLPAPIVHTSSYSRNLLRVAETRPDLFTLISPVFEFDLEARHALWECTFLFLLDLAFTPHAVEHHERQLAFLDHVIVPQRAIRFAVKERNKPCMSLDDLDVFAHALILFFGKYTTGYCNDKVMHKWFSLAFRYLRPCFRLQSALTKVLHDLPPSRNDIGLQISRYLDSHHH